MIPSTRKSYCIFTLTIVLVQLCLKTISSDAQIAGAPSLHLWLLNRYVSSQLLEFLQILSLVPYPYQNPYRFWQEDFAGVMPEVIQAGRLVVFHYEQAVSLVYCASIIR